MTKRKYLFYDSEANFKKIREMKKNREILCILDVEAEMSLTASSILFVFLDFKMCLLLVVLILSSMSVEVQSPRPARLLQHQLGVLQPDSTPASKHRRPARLSSPTSSISGTVRPFKPPGKLKRAREESDTDCAPAAKHRRPQWPTSPAPSVERWVLRPPRPTSVPLALGGYKTSAAVSEHIDRPKSLPSFD